MNRQNNPIQTAEADLPAKPSEIRMAEPSRGHEARNRREVRA